jgi:hypothetical protein
MAWAGTPQGPQAVTYSVSCPGFLPFEVTSPNPQAAAGGGSGIHAVIAVGSLQGNMPQRLVMICGSTDLSTGEFVGYLPFLIAPTRS